MRLNFCRAAAVLLGVYALVLPHGQASPLSIRPEDRSNSNAIIHHESSLTHALRSITSYLSPNIHLVEIFPELKLAKRRVITDDEGFGSAPTTGWGDAPKSGLGDAPKQGMGKKPKTGMGGKPKKKIGKKPKQGMGSKPKTGMGNKPRGYCATCSPTNDTPDPDRVAEPNTAALREGLTQEEANRVMEDNGRSWTKRAQSNHRDLTDEQADRVMDDHGQTWGRSLSEEELDREMSDNGRSWTKRETFATEARPLFKGDLHWDKRTTEPGQVGQGGANQERANQTPAFDKRFRVYEGPTRRPLSPHDERDAGKMDRVVEDAGARWTKRMDERGTCVTCTRDVHSKAGPESGKTDKPLKDIDWQKRTTEDGAGGDIGASTEWGRRSSPLPEDREAQMQANADFEWGKRQHSGTVDSARRTEDRMKDADVVGCSGSPAERGVCASCLRACDFGQQDSPLKDVDWQKRVVETGKTGRPLQDIDWQKRMTEDGRGGGLNAGSEWGRHVNLSPHNAEPDMQRAYGNVEWDKRQEPSSDELIAPSDRVTQPDGFITVDKRNDPEPRSQGLFERVTAAQLAQSSSNMAKREVSDVLWEFIPEGQSRIGRT